MDTVHSMDFSCHQQLISHTNETPFILVCHTGTNLPSVGSFGNVIHPYFLPIC